MNIDSDAIISGAEANQSFSHMTRIAEEKGSAVTTSPRYSCRYPVRFVAFRWSASTMKRGPNHSGGVVR